MDFFVYLDREPVGLNNSQPAGDLDSLNKSTPWFTNLKLYWMGLSFIWIVLIFYQNSIFLNMFLKESIESSTYDP
jgi:hypothetical protein